jgi:hypothetical protein
VVTGLSTSEELFRLVVAERLENEDDDDDCTDDVENGVHR